MTVQQLVMVFTHHIIVVLEVFQHQIECKRSICIEYSHVQAADAILRCLIRDENALMLQDLVLHINTLHKPECTDTYWE